MAISIHNLNHYTVKRPPSTESPKPKLIDADHSIQHPGTLHYTTLLVFKRFFSALDIFVIASAIVHAAPIVGAAI